MVQALAKRCEYAYLARCKVAATLGGRAAACASLQKHLEPQTRLSHSCSLSCSRQPPLSPPLALSEDQVFLKTRHYQAHCSFMVGRNNLWWRHADLMRLASRNFIAPEPVDFLSQVHDLALHRLHIKRGVFRGISLHMILSKDRGHPHEGTSSGAACVGASCLFGFSASDCTGLSRSSAGEGGWAPARVGAGTARVARCAF